MNQQILSQDEVDALLQGITGESQKLEQEEQPSRRHPRLRPGQPGAHRPRAHADDGGHQRALRAQHPHRAVQPHPQEPEVSIGGIKVQKFSAFLREIVVPTNFNIVSGQAAARQRA
jgi:flagellar motor switch protein FliM